MMNKTNIILFLCLTLSLALVQCQSKPACHSPLDDEPLVRLKNDNGNETLIFGNISNTSKTESFNVTELSLYDCKNQHFLIDHAGDEINEFNIKQYIDSTVLTSFHFVPVGDDWDMVDIPYLSQAVYYKNDTLVLTPHRLVFHYPDVLSKTQTDSITSICRFLDHFESETQSFYPLDYETLYILFVGAIKNVVNSRIIFENLENKFIFDGAQAETLAEIAYETIVGG